MNKMTKTDIAWIEGYFIGFESRKENMNCSHNAVNKKYTVKIIAPNSPDPRYPKYVPMVKELCADCGAYLKFAKQTPELIAAFNKELGLVTVSEENL